MAQGPFVQEGRPRPCAEAPSLPGRDVILKTTDLRLSSRAPVQTQKKKKNGVHFAEISIQNVISEMVIKQRWSSISQKAWHF